jgi:phosphate-selective porin OprO/OprP
MGKKILLISTILSLSAASALAQTTEQRLDDLEKEVKILRHQLEVEKQQRAAAPAKKVEVETAKVVNVAPDKSANVEFDKNGVKVSSKDGKSFLKIRGFVEADNRTFFNDSNQSSVDTFTVRHVRPIIESQFDDFALYFAPDFAGGTTKLYDAYVDFKPSKYLNLRMGKFKAPVGLEHLKASQETTFAETGLPSNLISNRDTGLMAYGNVIPEVEYQIGVFNGVPNAAMDDTDAGDSKDIDARVFIQPFKTAANAFKGLGFGLSGTYGTRDGSLTARDLGTAKTAGQGTFFQYKSTTFAKGDVKRLSPQAYYYYGPLGILTEYILEEEDVKNGTSVATIKNNAWQAQLTYVLTGEDATYKWVSPARPFSVEKGQWGAWEVGVGIGELTIDNAAFNTFADSTVAAKKAKNYGLVLNGYLSDNVKIKFDYEYTGFDGGAAAGKDRQAEQVLISRVTYKF